MCNKGYDVSWEEDANSVGCLHTLCHSDMADQVCLLFYCIVYWLNSLLVYLFSHSHWSSSCMAAVWLSCCMLLSINEVALHRTWLVLGWVTVSWVQETYLSI